MLKQKSPGVPSGSEGIEYVQKGLWSHLGTRMKEFVISYESIIYWD